jgi:NAD(P)-dependent dehydrogenase (short-subunit alcohol dehydrogenase family)
MERMKDRVAIVTGGGSGIGEATAKLLAVEGARVAIVDVDEPNGRRVAGEIREAGGNAGFWRMDVSLEPEVKATFAEIFDSFSALHVLVNNAGIAGGGGPPDQTSIEEWDHVMNINLRGSFLCIKHAIPYIRKTGEGGSIVNVSSIMGIMAGPTHVYCTSKGGVRHMTKSDACVYAAEGIRVNSVHPGYIVTPLFTNLAAKSKLGVEGSIQDEASRIPLGRMGRPEDIANGILYLASDEASYVTGIELVIDGGKLMR